MPDAEQHPKPDISLSLSTGVAVTEFITGRGWITLRQAGLPYPVTVSLAVGTGGRLRCTGLVLGIPDPAGAGVVEITSASLRKIRITELLQAIADEITALFSPSTVTAAELADLAGPGFDPDDFKSTDGGRTYQLPPIVSYSGPRKSRPFLDQLIPGLVPDLPLAGPRVRGQALPRAHFEMVASEYRLAIENNSRAPMRGLMQRLEDWKGYPVPEPTARRWVQRARDMGLLGESRPGVAGEYFPEQSPQEGTGFPRYDADSPAAEPSPAGPDSPGISAIDNERP